MLVKRCLEFLVLISCKPLLLPIYSLESAGRNIFNFVLFTQNSLLRSLIDEVLKVREPVHVKSLVFVEGHAFDESTEVLVDAEAFQVLSD